MSLALFQTRARLFAFFPVIAPSFRSSRAWKMSILVRNRGRVWPDLHCSLAARAVVDRTEPRAVELGADGAPLSSAPSGPREVRLRVLSPAK